MQKPLIYVRSGEGREPVEVCIIRRGEPFLVIPLTPTQALTKAADLLSLALQALPPTTTSNDRSDP